MVDQFIQEQEDSSFCPVDTSQADNRNQRISARAQERGLKHALALQKSFADQGFQASPSAMSAVLSSSYSVEDLKFASKTMGIKADAYHWATLIRNAVQGGRARDAVTIYHHAKADGIRPNAIMVHPLLRALCSSKLRTPKDSDIHCALAIYRGLVPPQPDSPSSPPPSLKPTTKGSVVDVAIYNTLLRALVSSQNTEEFFPIALSLVEDMDTHNVAMDTMTTASITILLMRSAPSFSQAFDVYKRMRVLKGGGGINLEGYVAILRAFSKLPFPRKSPFSLDPYFHIIRDMRDAGHPAASGKDDNFVRDAVVGIKRIHQQLLVEGSFTPNTHDWNSLMQAYSFAGCCPEVIRIWNMIYVNGIFDSASVNIVIDACGYGGQAQLASHIWSQLLSSGFILSSHNWGTFLECLCRAGQLDEAVKRLCCEIEEPDPEHLRILLKFATPHGRGHMVKKRIKEFLPDFWKKLSPEIIRM
ncbi:hypothetical protein JAAARDRAFT_119556 [Jaapia argillacea MUCL 33604]|uniref:Pentacotripeptide-repeat region of PRORP domain-containing protein n=1 Tax=Jaapia argillacea MUCL 33604 TaxID=933084 RepID=A0A067QIC3_9AGAM|nr:hypothetical protein JAAARDRAFT_119556 [Jaapia argillacea MUCL 33604]